MPYTKLYNELINKYTSNIKYAYDLSKKIYYRQYVFKKIPKIEYILNIAKNITQYDESIIISAILYNPYLENVYLKKYNFPKSIRKISKDIYYLNYLDIIQNKSIPPEEIKEYILNTFYKIESVTIIIIESITILNYFNKIDNSSFKKRFLDIIDKSIIPLTYQLGMYNLRDIILEKLVYIRYPKKYKQVKKYLLTNFPKKNLDKFKDIIINYLKKNNVKPVAYFYRYKSVGSFYYKVNITRKIPIDQVSDIYAIRLLYDTKKQCYNSLNFLKKKFNIYDNKIFDFIKYPKDNGYKSIHFKVEIIGYPVEIQIRTLEMDNNANYGVAAHFHYKQIPLVSQESKIKNYLKKKYKLSKQENDSGYKDFIFVFTATNEKISIPKKSTLFDFAFTLHTSFAEKFNYALVNNKKVTDKGYRLKNADKIKIIRDNKITIEEKDIDFLFNKKNKKLFNSLLNKINKNI